MYFQEIITILKDKIVGWAELFIANLPNFIVAIIVFAIFYYLAKIVRKTVRKALEKTSLNQTIRNLIAVGVYIVIILLGGVVVLSVLKLDTAVTSILAGIGVLGLALGFAFQDIASNFISGILMAFDSPVSDGDVVEIDGKVGVVSHTNLRTTVVTFGNGTWLYVPNQQIFQNQIVNYSKKGMRRVTVYCGIDYDSDLEHVKQTTVSAIKTVDRAADTDIDFFYEEFADSSINFRARFWITEVRQKNMRQAKSDAIVAIKKAFDTENITIPYPIQIEYEYSKN